LFARNIIVRPDDGHIIYDKDTYEIKNKGKDICIGNHVWVTGNSAILKGVHIDDNCIIGHGSIVTKSSTEPNAVYAGVPAKLVRENINWTRSIEEYKNIIPYKS
jgi:acetyltransferase-like isoleucine patch superfamily enzyme